MKTHLWFGLVLWSQIVSFSSCQITITTFDLPSVQNAEENFNALIEFSVDLSGQDQSDIFQLVKTFRLPSTELRTCDFLVDDDTEIGCSTTVIPLKL